MLFRSGKISKKPTVDPTVPNWVARVSSNSGILEANSVSIASAFIGQISVASYYTKIRYLNALLGSNLNAALVPLIDRGQPGVETPFGNATNTNFVDGDFSQSTGLQGNGVDKLLSVPASVDMLSPNPTTNLCGGFGVWVAGHTMDTYGYFMGISRWNTVTNFRLEVDNSNNGIFWWGSNNVTVSSQAGIGHFYGQRSSSINKTLAKGGIVVGTNSSFQDLPTYEPVSIAVMGIRDLKYGTSYYSGRSGLFYLTDGTLTTQEQTDLNNALSTYLISATGK